MDELRAILGDGLSDDVLEGLLTRFGGNVSAAANAFFDGSLLPPAAPRTMPEALPDDVMSTLFKTLEDVRKQLAEREQQLDMAARVSEVLQRRLLAVEHALAVADANKSEREDAEEEARSLADTEGDPMPAPPVSTTLSLTQMPLHFLRIALPRLFMPLHVLGWAGRLLGVARFVPPRALKRQREDEPDADNGDEGTAEAKGEVCGVELGEQEEGIERRRRRSRIRQRTTPMCK